MSTSKFMYPFIHEDSISVIVGILGGSIVLGAFGMLSNMLLYCLFRFFTPRNCLFKFFSFVSLSPSSTINWGNFRLFKLLNCCFNLLVLLLCPPLLLTITGNVFFFFFFFFLLFYF